MHALLPVLKTSSLGSGKLRLRGERRYVVLLASVRDQPSVMIPVPLPWPDPTVLGTALWEQPGDKELSDTNQFPHQPTPGGL